MMSAEVDAWTVRLRELAATLVGDAAHDLCHLDRVTISAVRIARAEDARLEIVLPSAWLHDCVTVPKDSPQRGQASRLAAVRAVELLRELGYPGEFFDAIAHCIEAHSFSAGIEPRTLEARVVQDADRVDALGAIGIARCFSVGGALQRSIYSEVDPFCMERSPDDSTCSVDHFFQKLFRIATTMQTAAGRDEAARRVAFMHGYVDQLAQEIGINPPRPQKYHP